MTGARYANTAEAEASSRTDQAVRKICAIVGAGRVGRTLGYWLVRDRWRLSAVVTRRLATARAACRFIGGGVPVNRLGPHVWEASLILVAVPDRLVGSVAQELARLAPGTLRGKVVLHTSGVLPSEALQPLARRGARVASFHPLQSFSSRQPVSLDGVVFAIEGDPQAAAVAQRLARRFGGIPVRIAAERKVLYHAGATMASPQLLAVIETSVRLLQRAGFRRSQAVQAALRLARQTLDNYERSGPQAAWTGPIARGDWETVRAHRRTLAPWPRAYREAYRALTQLQALVLDRARRRTQKGAVR